ncbi:MAG: DUF362 domain-containing protein [Pyrinomonadaceae bacterium]|nr:DUF362 domain-containing protein [Pyrinomonadaceae bacterium]
MENSEKSIVAIAHTSEKHRSQERVLQVVREAIDILGGMKKFVKTGDTVLLKPNLTVFYGTEEGCTTDPLVVGALIRLAKEAGAARVIVGESSGEFFDSIQCMKITGVAAVAEREGAEMVDLGSDDTPSRDVKLASGEIVPRPAPILDADVIINVPKAKTHHYEPVSGALKNWMGTCNQNWRQIHHGDDDSIKRFVEIMAHRKPDLNVVDALIAGEGDGPIANQPHWCGCILASTDPVAIDVSMARLLSQEKSKISFKYAAEAERQGLGTRTNIEYVGRQIDEVKIPAWGGHEGFDYLPINFLVGTGVSLAGTIGHVKSAIDSMLRRNDLNNLIWLKGTPTIMIGNVNDPQFEEHLKECPYLVFDDSAKAKYKNDARVHFVKGHPVLRDAMTGLLKGLGADANVGGQAIMAYERLQRWGQHNLEYGTRARQILTVAKPLVVAGIAVAGVFALGKLIEKVAGKSE